MRSRKIHQETMISTNITHDRISGLERLFQVFPSDFSFKGFYLKGVLFHENGDIQLTYSLKKDRTYLVVFILSDCISSCEFSLSTSKTPIVGIDLSESDGNQSLFRFIDKTNHVNLECRQVKITTHVLLSEAFAKEQAAKLTQEFSDTLQKKFLDLERLEPLPNGEPLFRRDDTYHGIFAPHHTMYKLKDLSNKDGSVVYEFLIEFDRNNPSLGIYYGCKALIKKGDNLERQISLQNEWNNHIKKKVNERLNKHFPYKKFDNRFKPTDNANDNTFWPFWISLYEDENIVEVAVRATIIIRDEYKRHLEGDNYLPDETCKYKIGKNLENKNGEAHSESRFTEESWKELREPWKDKKGESNTHLEKLNKKWAELLDRFIAGAVRMGMMTENVDGYEKAFMYHVTTKEFSLMLRLLTNRLSEEKKVPWRLICRQFLDKKGEIVSEDTMKKSCERYLKTRHSDYFDCDTNEKRLKCEKEKPYDFVVKFREIMN